ncbi:MAG: SUMF1/EgtB/PvdO family nonheme iron enzyme [Pirellulales bacterium]|nr:SUMF1/EgtB/PvdO family nonheme iron enzyme [Pirellulales bacterium]
MKILRTAPCFAVLVASLMASADAHASSVTFGTGINQFAMEFVQIGNPGNAADATGNPNPAGSVAYGYNIGKYEVSRDMVTKASSEGALGITLADMSLYGGNGIDRPATGVNWNEAARFANWLNTSQGYSPAYKFGTQPGDVGYSASQNISLWVSGDAGFNSSNPFRNSLARYFLPSVDEWYKAAYYDPNASGGAGGYWNYPTGSDTAPTAVAGGTAASTAIYKQPVNQGPNDVNQAGGLSPYGAMGLGGNVYEWQETEYDLVNNSGGGARINRGGSWSALAFNLSASDRAGANPTDENQGTGFRVASVPEPSGAVLAGLGIFTLIAGQLRRRHR